MLLIWKKKKKKKERILANVTSSDFQTVSIDIGLSLRNPVFVRLFFIIKRQWSLNPNQKLNISLEYPNFVTVQFFSTSAPFPSGLRWRRVGWKFSNRIITEAISSPFMYFLQKARACYLSPTSCRPQPWSWKQSGKLMHIDVSHKYVVCCVCVCVCFMAMPDVLLIVAMATSFHSAPKMSRVRAGRAWGEKVKRGVDWWTWWPEQKYIFHEAAVVTGWEAQGYNQTSFDSRSQT